MKKILSFLLLVFSMHLYAQEILITGININIPAYPDANTANWGTGSSVFVITATTIPSAAGINAMVKESKILLSIKKGGSKVCGSYTAANAPLSNFNNVTETWGGINAAALLGQNCILKPGEYELCVQFFNQESRSISKEKCKPFTIKAEEQQSYQPPQAISPADGTIISEQDAKSPMTFRWTPVVPKPREEVVYKVRIIEIRQGQTSTSALKTNRPIFEKEVTNQTQLVGTSLNQLPIAENSQYAWYVQAVNIEGKPIGENDGMSSCLTFTSVIDGTILPICKCKSWNGKTNFIVELKNGSTATNWCGGKHNVTSKGTSPISIEVTGYQCLKCNETYRWEVRTMNNSLIKSGNGSKIIYSTNLNNLILPPSYQVIFYSRCGKVECEPSCILEIN